MAGSALILHFQADWNTEVEVAGLGGGTVLCAGVLPGVVGHSKVKAAPDSPLNPGLLDNRAAHAKVGAKIIGDGNQRVFFPFEGKGAELIGDREFSVEGIAQGIAKTEGVEKAQVAFRGANYSKCLAVAGRTEGGFRGQGQGEAAGKTGPVWNGRREKPYGEPQSA